MTKHQVQAVVSVCVNRVDDLILSFKLSSDVVPRSSKVVIVERFVMSYTAFSVRTKSPLKVVSKSQ